MDYRFQKAPDGTRETTLTLALTDAGLVYDQFPYPLAHLTGTITYDPNAVRLTNLAAHYPDDRTITLNGRVSELTSGRPDFEIHVEAERIPVDAVLIQAMPPVFS